jgi:hypothetical protein
MSLVDDFEQRFEALEGLVREDPLLAREFQDSAPEFFQGRFDPARQATDELARRRHLEWFLLERTSPRLEGLAIQRLAEIDAERAGLDDPLRLAVLLNSHAGIFEVSGVKPGEGLWLRDLSSGGEYPVLEPEAAQVLEKGDLIAGRIFPTTEGAHRLSRAAAFYRNRSLLEALRGDLERARAARRGVVRINQRELESMFFAADLTGTPADPVGEARALLLRNGVEREQIDQWFEELAQTPFERERLVVGVDDALGPLLDRLAFDSTVDLDAARRALVHAWESLATSGIGRGISLTPQAPPRTKSQAAVDTARALAEFEAKRKAGLPLEQIFSDLEKELALEDGSDVADAEEVSPAPDFPGVVGAMITEFLWETEREAGPERVLELRPLESFGRYAHDIGVFENLSTRDLLSYTAWWLPESGEIQSGDDARALLSALSSFLRWVDETQDLHLHAEFHATLSALMESLPRVIEANRRRTRSADPSQGELYEILALRDGHAVVRDRTGVESEAQIEPDLAAWLKPADRMRANRMDDGRLAVYCCYPPEARGLAPEKQSSAGADEAE